MLNADTTTPNTHAHMGTFGDILHNVLSAAAFRVAPHITLEHSVFDVVKGEYPPSPADFDAFIITASAASTLDKALWIRQLEKYVRFLYESHPEARLFGSCFGHHLVCQALLQHFGLRIEKHRQGWEIGVNTVYFTKGFMAALGSRQGDRRPRDVARIPGRLPSPDTEYQDDRTMHTLAEPRKCNRFPASMRLQFVHEDQAVWDGAHTALHAPWMTIGSTDHCAIQGVYFPGRVLTLQGHFEFDKFEDRKTMRIFGAAGEGEEDGQGGCAAMEAPGGEFQGRAEDDGVLMAELVLHFLVGTLADDVLASKSTERTIDLGLLTPRSSLDI